MDAAAGGAFLSLTLPRAIALVEKMASNQGWSEERLQPCKRGGMHQVKEVDMCVYRKGDSISAQNYSVALLLVRTKCRIYIFPKGRREDILGTMVR